MRVFEAVQYIPEKLNSIKRVFLAGSIEMGAAEEWQSKVIESLRELAMEDLVVFNPRRKNWDANWVQSISNPEFNEQVTWEMDQLHRANYVFFNFCRDTKSPISLLELGLMASYAQKPDSPLAKFGLVAPPDKKIIVCCPDGFWRKGNVEMVCHRYGITMCEDFNAAVSVLRTELQLGN